jgi:aspartyl-tRNA(Asn)/glutamyl-tRNA(Gln) amidotransferase subunit A
MILTDLSIQESKTLLQKKAISSEELVRSSLARIVKTDPEIHAFVEVFRDEALSQARAIDHGRCSPGKEEERPYAGIPIAVKDNILMQGKKATACSQILEEHTAAFDATIILRLKQAGFILLGRANMDEAAMGSSTETSHYGPTKNPWDPSKVPGGTSGGSTAAVAARMVPGALGTDTGGSIRQPASLCGVVGLKPTYGRVSRFGLIADASSLQQAGPITRTVEDAAAVLRMIEGKDERDATSQALSETTLPELLQMGDIRGVKIGMPKEYFIDGMDPEVEDLVRAALRLLESHGADLRDISLPHTPYALATYYVIQPAEVSSNLARYDGMRFSARATGATLAETYAATRTAGFGTEVKRRILVGTFTLSAGYFDAYYKKAVAVRTLIRRDFDEAFKDVDVILTPTSPSVAWGLGEKMHDPITMYLADIFTAPANLAGLPGLSIPCGFARNLPVGLQLIGRAFDEQTLFRVGHFYQRLTDWHTKGPALAEA